MIKRRTRHGTNTDRFLPFESQHELPKEELFTVMFQDEVGVWKYL